MILLTHPGTNHSYQLANQLVRHNRLGEFWTGLAIRRDAWYGGVIEKLLPDSWGGKFANRMIRNIPAKYVRTKPMIGLKAIYQLRHAKSSQDMFYRINCEFQKRIPISAIEKSSAVIGFDTASWIIAETAIKLGKPFFLDQSTSHPLAKDTVWQTIGRQFPEWKNKLEKRVSSVLDAENQEHHLATKIVVASSYTKQTLTQQGVLASKIAVNPYGVDTLQFSPAPKPRKNQPLRFLYLGNVTALKGIPLLLEAWRSPSMQNCELWLVGLVSDHERSLIPSLRGLKVLGKCLRKDLPELIKQCDVLVFPSYSDGFGLVLLEALASGLPIITTEATGGPDLIQNGVEGLIIPSGDRDALQSAMTYFVDNPEKLQDMAEAARSCAEKFTWNAYGDRWNQLLDEFI
jgi:glycosyltransferase involved in cell wall biosynthesis